MKRMGFVHALVELRLSHTFVYLGALGEAAEYGPVARLDNRSSFRIVQRGQLHSFDLLVGGPTFWGWGLGDLSSGPADTVV